MELAEQVVSLELAKRLKELGVPDNSHLLWVEKDFIVSYNQETNKSEVTETKWHLYDNSPRTYFGEFNTIIPAYSVAELGKMLPRQIDYEDNFYLPKLEYKHKYYKLSYFNEFKNPYYLKHKNSTMHEHEFFIDEIQANALAKMLISLLEKKFIKVEDLKL